LGAERRIRGEGWALRCPIMFRGEDSKTIKTKHLDADLPADTIITGI
jgi:hypothetical protein